MFEQLKADLAAHGARIAATDFSGMPKDKLARALQSELADTILPIFEELVGMIQRQAAETDSSVEMLAAALDDMTAGDVLSPETTAKIVGVFEVGKLLANELEAVMAQHPDEVKRKRLGTLIAGYRTAVEQVTEVVADATVEYDDQDDDGGDADDADDDQDDADDEDTNPEVGQ